LIKIPASHFFGKNHNYDNATGWSPYAFILTAFLVLGSSEMCFPQRSLTLDSTVHLAKSQSAYFQNAKNNHQRAYWRFANFKAGFKPQIRFQATIPTFYRAINPVTQPDGTIQFVRVSQANNMAGLSVNQNIGFTGGTLRAGTSLQRTDNFSGSQSNYFLSTPVQISYSQSSLLYNDFRWHKKLEPLYFETAQQQYDEDIEEGIFQAVRLFLTGMETQLADEIARTHLAIADTLHLLARERVKIGTIPVTDLLQLELNVLTSRNDVYEAQLGKEDALLNLKRFLGLGKELDIVLKIPNEPKDIQILYRTALDYARQNRTAVMKFRTERLKADQEIARAKGQNSLEIGLLANLGSQQTATGLRESYKNLQNQQYIGLSIDIPIQDWGLRKSQIRLANANRELVEVNMGQEELLFEHEVYTHTKQFNQRFQQLSMAQRIDSVAGQRLYITRERYLLGKLNVAELSLAWQESVNARHRFVKAVNNYWLSFFALRRLTLHDFIQDESLKHQRVQQPDTRK
jgi:outer membrane protein TolC